MLLLLLILLSVTIVVSITIIAMLLLTIIPTTRPSIIHNTKATQLTLQIIPTTFRTTPMTKVRTSTQFDITLVEVIRFVIGGFGAKGTFFDDYVGGGDAKVIAIGGEVG